MNSLENYTSPNREIVSLNIHDLVGNKHMGRVSYKHIALSRSFSMELNQTHSWVSANRMKFKFSFVPQLLSTDGTVIWWFSSVNKYLIWKQFHHRGEQEGISVVSRRPTIRFPASLGGGRRHCMVRSPCKGACVLWLPNGITGRGHMGTPFTVDRQTRLKTFTYTGMHSSRTHTVCCSGRLGGGGICLGVCLPRGMSA